MKKSTIGVTIALMIIVVGFVGFYAIMTGKAKTEAADEALSPVQIVLSRDLNKDYPATVKEVIKYYVELERCIYNESCSEEELEQLCVQARRMYDDDLQAINEIGTFVAKMKEEVGAFHEAQRRISNIAIASSTNVDFFSEDGFDFARTYCGYSISEGGKSKMLEGRVYLLRKDENKRWKIYGWANANDVNPQ